MRAVRSASPSAPPTSAASAISPRASRRAISPAASGSAFRSRRAPGQTRRSRNSRRSARPERHRSAVAKVAFRSARRDRPRPEGARMSAVRRLLVELLVEELPPKALKKLSAAFADALVGRLQGDGLVVAAKRTEYATPRRLAVLVD